MTPAPKPHLKEIGNRIANLSYREMTELSEALANKLNSGDDNGRVESVSVSAIVAALLAFSDEIAMKDALKPAAGGYLKRGGEDDFGTRRVLR